MKKIISMVTVGIALGFFSGLSAQTATPKVTERQVNQQVRIHQGVQNGELTKGETTRLEGQQAKIQADKKAAKSDGVVTPAERKKLKREQHRASKNIYHKKHNEKVN